jgi:hypothetical protein
MPKLMVINMPFRKEENIRNWTRCLVALRIALSVCTLEAAHGGEPGAALLPRLDELSATRDRPLFSPSRRPRPNKVAPTIAVAPPSPPPAPVPPPNLTFFGTFESATEVGAAVQIPPNDQPTIIRYGTIINGWRVVDISNQRLALAFGDRITVFTLFDRPAASSDQASRPTPPPTGRRPFPPITTVKPPASPRTKP